MGEGRRGREGERASERARTSARAPRKAKGGTRGPRGKASVLRNPARGTPADPSHLHLRPLGLNLLSSGFQCP